MRQFFGFTAKRIQNLSASRIDTALRCVAQLFYVSLLRISPPLPSHPAGLNGNGLHYVAEQLVIKVAKEGKLNLDEMEETVTSYTNFVMAVMEGVDVIPGKGAYPIEWLAPWEKEFSVEDQLKAIEKKKLTYRIKTRAALEAVYYMLSRGTRAVEMKAEKPFRLLVQSTINPHIKVPVNGIMDVFLRFPSERVVVHDWKTGKRSYFTEEKLRHHTQMLIYKRAVWEEYNVVPDTFIISLDLFKKQIDELKTLEEKQMMLLKEPFLVPVNVNYFEQWDNMQKLISEIWHVLMNLIYPAPTKEAQDKIKLWRPQSYEGKHLRLEEHLIQDRPVPNIGKHCEMCSAREMCQRDNALDWEVREKHLNRATLHSVTTKSAEEVQHAIATAIPLVYDLNLQLFEGGPVSELEKEMQKKYGLYNWPELGFIKVKASPKNDEGKKALWLWKFIPRHWQGILCPCVIGKWFWKALLVLYPNVKQEEVDYKEEQRKKRDADPKLKGTKIKPLRRSKIVEEAVKQCPIKNCPHRCNPNPKNGNGFQEIHLEGEKDEKVC